MKTRMGAVFLVVTLVSTLLFQAGCSHPKTMRVNLAPLPRLPDNQMAPAQKHATTIDKSTTMNLMATVNCGERLRTPIVTYMEYQFDHQLVRVLWGPYGPGVEYGRIALECNGDITLIDGFVYVSMTDAPPLSAGGGSPPTTSPAAIPLVPTRPWVKAKRVNAQGVGTTWAVEIDDSNNVDRVYFVTGTRVNAEDSYDTSKKSYLYTLKTFLAHNDLGASTSEVPYDNNSLSKAFVDFINPYCCLAQMPPPHTCP